MILILVYIAANWLHRSIANVGANLQARSHRGTFCHEPADAGILSTETTRKHCFILENCYDWSEMNTLNMAQNSVLVR